MTRTEFTGVIMGFLAKKIPSWLPEESTEDEMLDILQKRMQEHSDEIKKVLRANSMGL